MHRGRSNHRIVTRHNIPSQRDLTRKPRTKPLDFTRNIESLSQRPVQWPRKRRSRGFKRAGHRFVTKESIFRMNIRPLCSPFFSSPSPLPPYSLSERQSRRLGNFVASPWHPSLSSASDGHDHAYNGPIAQSSDPLAYRSALLLPRRHGEKVPRLITRARSTKPWKVGCKSRDDYEELAGQTRFPWASMAGPMAALALFFPR